MTETATDATHGETGRDYTAYKDVPAPMERIDHPGGFRAAFDLTAFPDEETAREFLEAFGLVDSEPPSGGLVGLQMGEDDTSDRFIWRGDDLVMATTTNPVTGAKNRFTDDIEREYYEPENHLGECGYIHLIGDEETVREAVAEIEDRAATVKARTVGEWGY